MTLNLLAAALSASLQAHLPQPKPEPAQTERITYALSEKKLVRDIRPVTGTLFYSSGLSYQR